MKLRSPNLSQHLPHQVEAPSGALFRQRAVTGDGCAPAGKSASSPTLRGIVAVHSSHGAAFAGVYLFTLLLYARPNDLFPFLGSFPLAKIVAISITVIYVVSKITAGEELTRRPLELFMLLAIALLGFIFMPVSASPGDSFEMLTDPFLKTALIFALMINLIDSRRRLLSIWKMVVVCGMVLGLDAVKSYINGEFTVKGLRIKGLVGGIFGNPNDLATAIDLLVPLAVVLAILSKGWARWFYLFCAVAMAIGVLATFSRGGFLGLFALGLVLLWKLGRGRRLKTMLLAALACGLLLAAAPGGYGSRLSTIFNIEEDKTGSAQERRALMELAVSISLQHPVVGIGMGNFHIYSRHEQEAHNAYLEIAAELGFLGLLAYLIVIFAPLCSLARIENCTANAKSGSAREMYLLSVCLQSTFVAYLVCSFFTSIQYLWYLYYAAAYAVALRQIYAAEQAAKDKELSLPNSQALIAEPVQQTKRARGVLWPSYRLRQGVG